MSKMDEYPQTNSHWAQPVQQIRVEQIPLDAINLNINGRRLTGALQGFGPLWEKVYTIRLSGLNNSAQEVMRTWQENFARFQPQEVHFHPPVKGVLAGEFMPIDFMLPIIPGLPEIIPMASGVDIIYQDDTSFSVMTVEGFPISGWNTFSVYEQDGGLVAEVYSLVRMTDPVYELGYTFLGGSQKQEKNWIVVLQKLAAYYEIEAPVDRRITCLDPRHQWREARNVWMNAAIRTFFYTLAAPVRWVVEKVKS